jgi:hypothetical protein
LLILKGTAVGDGFSYHSIPSSMAKKDYKIFWGAFVMLGVGPLSSAQKPNLSWLIFNNLGFDLENPGSVSKWWVHTCAAGFALLNLPKGKSLGRS